MHKATDDAVKALDDSIDKYVEVYMGTYGRPRLTGRSNTVQVQNLTEKTITRFVKACITYLEGPLVARLKPRDTDLVNIRDEMLGTLNQLLYLFSLN